MHPIPLVIVNLRDRRIDRNLVEVWPAETRQLGIDIGVNASSKERIVTEIQSGNDMRSTRSHLLRFCKKVVGISIEDHACDRLDRDKLLRNNLRRIEHVKAELFRLFFGKNLHAQLVFRVYATLYCFP